MTTASIDDSLFSARDIRETELYRKVAAFYSALHAPGEGRLTDATDLCASPDGSRAAFTGSTFSDLASAPLNRIGLLTLNDGEVRTLPASSGNDRTPRWSPNGRHLAFLSDRADPGNYQLYLLNGDGTGPVRAAPSVPGLVEYFAWSDDSQRILLGVAGFGADLAGCQGGHTTVRKSDALPQWIPTIDSGDAQNLWRRIFVFDLDSGTAQPVSPEGRNFWEATWVGRHRIAVVTSESHTEGSWYRSTLAVLNLEDGSLRTLHAPADQIGVPAGNPAGTSVALIEAVCSDRMIVAGRVLLIDPNGDGARRFIDTADVDVTHIQWRDDEHLAYAGMRGFETVIGEIDARSGRAVETWRSVERTLAGWSPTLWPLAGGGCLAVAEAYSEPPAIVMVGDGQERVVCSLATAASAAPSFNTARAEPYQWQGRDGLEIQGWLIRPAGKGPFPLVMDIHGGPVWSCRNRWQGRLRGAKVLADHGFASLYPNPRGSSGRGADFARKVKGEMGGEDTYDYLTGIDALVRDGIADPKRVGTTGISYGGFMSAWLITQDTRFAAAAPISVVANWYSQHRTSQIPYFDALFLDGKPSSPDSYYFRRSPAMYADRVRTPTLQLTGALDQNTPPTQALEFHRSLLENGVTSVLATYPTAGHGIRGFPEVLDATTRYVGWMLKHLR